MVTIFFMPSPQGVQESHPAFQYIEALRPAGAAANASRVMPGASMLEAEELGGCVSHGTSTAAVAAGIEYGVSQNATIVPGGYSPPLPSSPLTSFACCLALCNDAPASYCTLLATHHDGH